VDDLNEIASAMRQTPRKAHHDPKPQGLWTVALVFVLLIGGAGWFAWSKNAEGHDRARPNHLSLRQSVQGDLSVEEEAEMEALKRRVGESEVERNRK
jgi:hypothetical protein